MVKPDAIYKLSDNELDAFIFACQSDMQNTSNKFYADLAYAQSYNILWAKAEKIRRIHKIFSSMEDVNAWLAREGYGSVPAMQVACVYHMVYGSSVIKFDDNFTPTIFNPVSGKFE
jgi:hypothetical protein